MNVAPRLPRYPPAKLYLSSLLASLARGLSSPIVADSAGPAGIELDGVDNLDGSLLDGGVIAFRPRNPDETPSSSGSNLTAGLR